MNNTLNILKVTLNIKKYIVIVSGFKCDNFLIEQDLINNPEKSNVFVSTNNIKGDIS